MYLNEQYTEDFRDITGNHLAIRALEIAAAGKHNIMLIGAPGTGKTMLGRRLPSILPPLTDNQKQEIIDIYKKSGMLLEEPEYIQHPFRCPHWSISYNGMYGKQEKNSYGEADLASHGVLFLDEITEFPKEILENLETKAKFNNFIIAAACTPCPCGYLLERNQKCTCRKNQIENWNSRINKICQILNINLKINLIRPEYSNSNNFSETSQTIQKRVQLATKTAEKNQIIPQMSVNAEKILAKYVSTLKITTERKLRLLYIAQTIANLEGTNLVNTNHLSEAIQLYRH